jgi:hypothetical protein
MCSIPEPLEVTPAAAVSEQRIRLSRSFALPTRTGIGNLISDRGTQRVATSVKRILRLRKTTGTGRPL